MRTIGKRDSSSKLKDAIELLKDDSPKKAQCTGQASTEQLTTKEKCCYRKKLKIKQHKLKVKVATREKYKRGKQSTTKARQNKH